MFVPQANSPKTGFNFASLNPEATAFKPRSAQNNAQSFLSQIPTAQQPAWGGFGSTSGSVLQPSKPAGSVDFSVPPLGSNKPFGSSSKPSTAPSSQATNTGFGGFANSNNSFKFGGITSTATPAKEQVAKPMFGSLGEPNSTIEAAPTQPKAPILGLGSSSTIQAGLIFGSSPAAASPPSPAKPSVSFAPNSTSAAAAPAQGKHRKIHSKQPRADTTKQRTHRSGCLPSVSQLQVRRLARSRSKNHQERRQGPPSSILGLFNRRAHQ
jgi:hypothetical protein